MTPLVKLIYDSIRFSDWAAGEGICPTDPDIREPADFLMDFLLQYDSGEVEDVHHHLAQRIAAEVERLQVFELGVEYNETDRSY